ncbi:MAG: TIGR03643 family protein [Puniceicoccaceae bacterium MED-G31]|nr:MAG: TIGR03643 family protein [Puniceicoccaceae bacterium MED-G31]
MNNTKLSAEQINAIIRMAWEDRTSFEEILTLTGLSEAGVIRIMRRELKPSSFRLWRKRVSGRVTKHRKRFERRMD